MEDPPPRRNPRIKLFASIAGLPNPAACQQALFSMTAREVFDGVLLTTLDFARYGVQQCRQITRMGGKKAYDTFAELPDVYGPPEFAGTWLLIDELVKGIDPSGLLMSLSGTWWTTPNGRVPPKGVSDVVPERTIRYVRGFDREHNGLTNAFADFTCRYRAFTNVWPSAQGPDGSVSLETLLTRPPGEEGRVIVLDSRVFQTREPEETRALLLAARALVDRAA